MKGRRLVALDLDTGLVGFNPRPREGATEVLAAEDRQKIVSIHAPVKGRLPFVEAPGASGKCFNPRPREGATYPS